MILSFPKHSDLVWPFNDNKPFITLEIKPYSSNEYVDPFPCYSHDEELVRSEAARIDALIKFPYEPGVFVTPFESHSRTNGYANFNHYHDRDPAPYVVLHGKRIPIMGPMTRYLLAHELGHTLHYSLKVLLKQKDVEEDGQFERDYAKMRNIEYNKAYGALKWHTNTAEVIANDIRIVLFAAEPDFWPHSYAHPLKCPEVVAYWNEMKDKYFAHV